MATTKSRAGSAPKRASKDARRSARNAKRTASHRIDRLIGQLPGPVRRPIERVRGCDILLYASGLAFYALISIVPLAIFALWIASLLAGDARVRELAKTLQQASPKSLDMSTLVQRVGQLGTSMGLPALITALWPASAYGAGLRRAFDRLSPSEPREAKGLRGRVLLLLVVLPIVTTGGLIGAFIGSSVLGGGTLSRVVGVILALVLGFVFTAVGVAVIYRIFPPERMDLRSILKATLWAASTIAVVSFLVILFVNLSSTLEQHFATGGIALIVVAAVWLFLSNALLLAGYRMARDRD